MPLKLRIMLELISLMKINPKQLLDFLDVLNVRLLSGINNKKKTLNLGMFLILN